MPELDVERIRRKTNRVKSDLEQLEGLHGAETATGQIVRGLHRRLNSLAHIAAEAFPDEEVVTFSGGTDKPPARQAEGDDED